MKVRPCKNCWSIGGNVGCDVCGPPLRERKARERLARRVFSLPLSDHALADYVEQQGAKHRKGVAGYLRHLVKLDREKWMDMKRLRELALSKLTDNERAALGFPPNV